MFIFYAKLSTACDVACANVSVRGQHKDVIHEGPLLTDDAEKLMPTLAPFDQQLDELLKLLSRTDYAGETVG